MTTNGRDPTVLFIFQGYLMRHAFLLHDPLLSFLLTLRWWVFRFWYHLPSPSLSNAASLRPFPILRCFLWLLCYNFLLSGIQIPSHTKWTVTPLENMWKLLSSLFKAYWRVYSVLTLSNSHESCFASPIAWNNGYLLKQQRSPCQCCQRHVHCQILSLFAMWHFFLSQIFTWLGTKCLLKIPKCRTNHWSPSEEG